MNSGESVQGVMDGEYATSRETRRVRSQQHAESFFLSLLSSAAGSSVKMLDGMEMEDARKGWMGNGGLLPRVGAV